MGVLAACCEPLNACLLHSVVETQVIDVIVVVAVVVVKARRLIILDIERRVLL